MLFKVAMLRGYGQAPLRRYVSKDEKGTIIVRSERSYEQWLEGRGGDSWIGWPKGEPVFEYEESAFKSLETLYHRGATDELKQEWKRCRAFTGN